MQTKINNNYNNKEDYKCDYDDEDEQQQYVDQDNDNNNNNNNNNIFNYILPELTDKSKYKRIAMIYCQKMKWKQPSETIRSLIKQGYRATVSFGDDNNQKTVTLDGNRKKETIYDAYYKLIPQLIPKSAALELCSVVSENLSFR